MLLPGPHRAAQPQIPTLRILRKYMAKISNGWSCWLQATRLLPATPPSSNHSSSSNHMKSQRCISGEYVGLVFLTTGAAGVFSVALVICQPCQSTYNTNRAGQ